MASTTNIFGFEQIEVDSSVNATLIFEEINKELGEYQQEKSTDTNSTDSVFDFIESSTLWLCDGGVGSWQCWDGTLSKSRKWIRTILLIRFTGQSTKVSLFFFGYNFLKNKETFNIFSPEILEVYRIFFV